MTNTNDRIDRAARAFNAAASELADALLAKLAEDAPEATAKVAAALESGERMVLALEINPAAPCIWWSTIDDYQQMKRIMTIPATGGTLQ